MQRVILAAIAVQRVIQAVQKGAYSAFQVGAWHAIHRRPTNMHWQDCGPQYFSISLFLVTTHLKCTVE